MCGVFRTSILCVFLCVSFDDFVLYCLILLLSCFFSVPSQKIGWEERLQNDLFRVKWDVTCCGCTNCIVLRSSSQLEIHLVCIL